jgi:hemolysin activation/secretion protein
MKTLFACTALALSTSAAAQNLDRIQPVPAPPMAPSPAQTPAPETSSAADVAPLLPELKGVVFVAKPEQLGNVATPTGGIDTSRVPFLTDDAFRARMKSFVGQPLYQQGLRRLLANVNLFYAAHDKPFVSVSTPEQEITDGVLRVLVVEGHVEDVRVEGNRYFPEDQYRETLALAAGDGLYRSQLDAGLDWINRNPFRSATLVAAPGQSFGGTQLIVRTRERFPLRTYVSADNTGTRNTDQERVAFGMNWGNALGLGHQLNYQLTASPDFDHSRGHSLSYVAPLSWRHLLTISAAWSRIDADMPADFDSAGQSWQTQVRYEVPLAPMHSVFGGLDFKRSDNNLEFGGIPVTDNSTDVVQAVIGYRASFDDRLGRTAAVVSVTHSPGRISDRNETQYFDISRWGAKSDYTYARLDVDRFVQLPARFAWRLSGSAQLASGNLLGSEQLGFAGTYGVRGFRDNEGFGDEGYLIRNELLLPRFSAFGRGDVLQTLAFYDYGVGVLVDPLPGERKRTTLSGAGVGARYSFGAGSEMRFEYAKQLHRLPGEAEHGDRVHFGVVFGY